MKKVLFVVVFLCVAPSCFAQLTREQKLTDFKALVALYDKNYGPFDWKKQVFGFDLLSTVLKLCCNSGTGDPLEDSSRSALCLTCKAETRGAVPSRARTTDWLAGFATHFRARLWCCSVYQIGAYALSSSNNSKNASATILNCESSAFSPRRGRDFPSRCRGTILLLPSTFSRFSTLRGLSGGAGDREFATIR